MTAADTLRQTVANLSTTALLKVAARIEAAATREKAERVLYAIACAELCRRLDLDPQEVARSALGPAEHLRLVAELREPETPRVRLVR